jgi:hypothetical protein
MAQKKHRTLAEGEATGHSHVVTAEDAVVIGDGEQRELSAPSGTKVVHEEHKTIELPKGDYDINRQRETDPDTEEARKVAD